MSADSVFAELVKIQSWPAVGLVFAVVIIIGYCLRFWKKFPNELIPLIVIASGAFAMVMLSDSKPLDVPYRVWNTKNAIVGLIVGFIAWMAHNLVISKIEDFLSTKFAIVDKALGQKSDSGDKPVEPPKT